MDPDDEPPSYEDVMNETGSSSSTRLPTNRRGIEKKVSSQPRPRAPSSPSVISSLPFAPEFRSRAIIGLYRASITDYLIAHSSHDPNPIAYVSTHLLSRPQIELHRTGSNLSPTIGTAELHTFSNAITIRISGYPVTANLVKEGIFVDTYSLYLEHPTSGNRELFEWRHSSGAEVRALNGKSRGLKLVRTVTGEIIAVYTAAISLSKIGKMQWLSSDSYGDVGELTVMLSILALAEEERRDE